MEHISEDQKLLEDIKPDTVSITIIQVIVIFIIAETYINLMFKK